MTGDDLKALRNAIGLTQGDMSAAMGLSLRPYTEVELSGDKAIKARHRLAAERVSLRYAVKQNDLNLALPSVRRDAIDYADMLRRGLK